MIEDGFLTGELAVAEPVRELHEVLSRRRSCSHLIRLADGHQLTAIELQTEYLDRARKFVGRRFGTDVDAQTADVLNRWEYAAGHVGQRPDGRWPTSLDWVAKLRPAFGVPGRAAGLVPPRACSWSTCSTPTCARTRACTTGWSAAAHMRTPV